MKANKNIVVLPIPINLDNVVGSMEAIMKQNAQLRQENSILKIVLADNRYRLNQESKKILNENNLISVPE